jgi:Uma2 family endonuclease
VIAVSKLPPGELAATADQRVFMHGVPWANYEILLAVRGDRAVPRLSYLEGTLEIMSPALGHEGTKKFLPRLIEAYAEELDIQLNGYGSWTLKSAPKARGAEPDECYVRGENDRPEVPDLAIEVIWTAGGIDKLEIYRGLGVREVWFWEEGKIRLFVLRDGAYAEVSKSAVLPELDLPLIARLVEEHTDQLTAVKALRHALRTKKRPRARSRRG